MYTPLTLILSHILYYSPGAASRLLDFLLLVTAFALISFSRTPRLPGQFPDQTPDSPGDFLLVAWLISPGHPGPDSRFPRHSWTIPRPDSPTLVTNQTPDTRASRTRTVQHQELSPAKYTHPNKTKG
jgi:hypothetical protein